MKKLLLIIMFFCFGFISNIDIDIKGKKGTYSITSGETYNFYVQLDRMVQIYVDLTFINLSYVPFDCIYINEYKSRNGTSLRNYTIEDISYPRPQIDCHYSFYYKWKIFQQFIWHFHLNQIQQLI